jgi:hypothetical protein
MLPYLMRHWRGDLPLSIAWWVNGLGLTGASLTLEALAGALGLLPEIDTRLRFGVFLATGVGLLLLLPAWQVIGIFRAADRHAAEVGTILAARLVQSLNTLLAILLATRFLVFAGESVPGVRLAWGLGGGHTVAVSHGGRVLEIRGSFDFGVADEAARALATNPRVRRVRLESGGGALGEARRLRELIIARDLDTDSREQCSSACVSAYMAGRHRLLARGARVGLHLPRNPGFGLRSPVNAAYAAELAWFGRQGVPLWFRMRWIASGREFWYPTPAQLRRAGVVQTYYGNPRPGEEFYFRR